MGNILPAKNQSAGDLSQKLFVGTMLSVSWQMALAVLVPTVAGYQLDNHFNTAPMMTLIGLTLAVAGSILVIRRALKDLNVYMMTNAAPAAEMKAKNSKQ